MIAAGVDLGSTTVKVALVKDQDILSTAIDLAGFSGHEKARELFNGFLRWAREYLGGEGERQKE